MTAAQPEGGCPSWKCWRNAIFPQTSLVKIKIEFHGEDLGALRDWPRSPLVSLTEFDINAMLVEQRLELVLPEGGGCRHAAAWNAAFWNGKNIYDAAGE